MEEEMERHRQHPFYQNLLPTAERQRVWNKTSASTMEPTGESNAFPAGEVYVQRIREISNSALNC